MANVVVNIAGRPYTMQCPDGEEDHLKELAKLLDTEVGRIRQSVGAIGDIRQLVMAGLMVADRLSEATRKMEDLQDQLNGLKHQPRPGPGANPHPGRKLRQGAGNRRAKA